MGLLVAVPAKGDEVRVGIRAQLGAVVQMMDFQMFSTATPLAAPAIALQHPPANLDIGIRNKMNRIGCRWGQFRRSKGANSE